MADAPTDDGAGRRCITGYVVKLMCASPSLFCNTLVQVLIHKVMFKIPKLSTAVRPPVAADIWTTKHGEPLLISSNHMKFTQLPPSSTTPSIILYSACAEWPSELLQSQICTWLVTVFFENTASAPADTPQISQKYYKKIHRFVVENKFTLCIPGGGSCSSLCF